MTSTVGQKSLEERGELKYLIIYTTHGYFCYLGLEDQFKLMPPPMHWVAYI